jgi:hypothetical protein
MKNVFLNAIAAIGLFFMTSHSLCASTSGDEHWDNQFGVVGINAATTAYVAVMGNTVYASGAVVTAAGNTRASGIAGFDGTNWFQLNAGLVDLNPNIIGLNVDSNYLYAGGIFTNADDYAAINSARWDGTSWANVGTKGGIVACIQRVGTNIYFGGGFTGFSIAGVVATNIVRWGGGTNWSALGQGLSGGFSSGVVSLAVQGNNLYAGGTFAGSGSSAMTNVAYWDGTSWHAMGNPFNGSVQTLMFYGAYLYAGGGFTNTSLAITNIARWDGSSWTAVPGGGANKSVLNFTSDGTNLFIAGSFTSIGGIMATGLVQFDGTTWTSIGTPLGFQGAAASVDSVFWHSNQLYVAGPFERIGNVGASSVARWDRTNWFSLGGKTSKGLTYGVNNGLCLLQVTGSTAIPNGLYAGGLFGQAGDVVVNCIGRWDGTNWNAISNGVSGNWSGVNGQRVLALASDNTNLYVGGIFTNAGNNYASGIARWNGTNWNTLGSGVDYTVNSVCVGSANNIWVGGQFTNAGGSFSKGLATWNTSSQSWTHPGNVAGTNAIAYALVYDGGTKVYIGGQFYSAGGANATNIAYYDTADNTWHAVGLGIVGGRVASLAYAGGILYAGGTFTNAGGQLARRIAKWDGSNWSEIGGGIVGNGAAVVSGISVYGGNVYVTGGFTNAGGIIASNIAMWNGTTWSALGSGLDNSRQGAAISVNGNDVYAVGNFNFAGDKPSQFFAHWNALSNYYAPAKLALTRSTSQTNKMFRFRVTGTSGQSYIIQGSTNLTAWTPLQTNSATFYDYVDTNAPSLLSRFYRAVMGQ